MDIYVQLREDAASVWAGVSLVGVLFVAYLLWCVGRM
jgi:hypothetical protein